MAEPLSRAAEDYGRAFCVPETGSAVPFDQLPPDQQQCVVRVGETWARKVEQRLGGEPAVPAVQRAHITGPQGTAVGTLTFADGTVTLCLVPQSGQRACRVVGFGHDAYEAAAATLASLGLDVHG